MMSSFSLLYASRSRRFLTLSMLVAQCVAGPAFGDDAKTYPKCDREPTESDVTAAKGAFEAGQVSFQEADYERAVLYWEDAFRRDCTAAPLLLNLSRAYELWGKKKLAVGALETFLERRPTYEDRPAIEKRIAALKKQVADEEAKSTPAPAAPLSPELTDEPEPLEEEERPMARPLWPIFVTGGGVLVGTIGLGIAASAQKTIDLCPQGPGGERRCASVADQNAAEDAVGPRNAGVVVMLGGAVAAVTGGVFWLVLWNQPETDATARIARRFSPVVTSDFAGLSYGSTF